MLERLKAILADHVEVNVPITLETLLLGDLGINSFELVQMVCEVEDEFGVEIPDDVIKGMRTVGDVVEFLESQS